MPDRPKFEDRVGGPEFADRTNLTWDKADETPVVTVEQILKLGRNQNKRGVNPAALFGGYEN